MRRRPRKVVDELQSDGENPLSVAPNVGSKVRRAVDAADAAQDRALCDRAQQERRSSAYAGPQSQPRGTSRHSLEERSLCQDQNAFIEPRYTGCFERRQACLRVGQVASVATRHLSGLHEPIGEAIGLALDRAIEHLDRVRICVVREHGAFRVQHEAGRLHLLADGRRVDPMQ
jgi:hypothetical protein